MAAVRFISTSLALALLLAMVVAGSGQAEESPKSTTFLAKLGVPPNRVEFSNGADKTDSSTSSYGSVVIAPLGSLSEDGWRVKLSGSYTGFSYSLTEEYCKTAHDEKLHGVHRLPASAGLLRLCDAIPGMSSEERRQARDSIAPLGFDLRDDGIYYIEPHAGTRYDFAITPGYQMTVGAFTLKAYAGAGYENNSITPADPSKSLDGGAWGAKGGIESWVTLSDALWLSADGSYFTGTSRYGTSMRLGYQPVSWLTLGPEIGAFGDRDDNAARAGGFLRFDAGQVETTLSGGLTSDYGNETSAYGAASVYMKF